MSKGKVRKLHKILSTGSIDEITKVIAQDVMKKRKYTIDVGDKEGDSPLALACRDNLAMPIIELLLAHGADVNHTNIYGTSPFGHACKGCHENLVKYFLQDSRYTGPKVDINRSFISSTGIIEVCRKRYLGYKMVEIINLLASTGCDVNATTHLQKTALHNAAECGASEAIQEILKLGGNADVLDHAQRHPFSAACFAGHYDCARILFPYTRNVNHRDKDGDNALHLACYKSSSMTIDLLLECGVDANQKNYKGQLPLNIAVLKSSLLTSTLTSLIIATKDLSNTNEGIPMLRQAVVTSNEDAVKLLLKYGADVNQQCTIGNRGTALIGLCRYDSPRNMNIIRMLLAAGADPNQTTNLGDTALHLCCDASDHGSKKGTIPMAYVRLLVDYGANIHQRNHNGSSPVSMAKSHNVPICIKYFDSGPGMNPHRDTKFEKYVPTEVDLLKSSSMDIARRILQTVRLSMIEGKKYCMTPKNYRYACEAVVDVLVDNNRLLGPVLRDNPRQLQVSISDVLIQFYSTTTETETIYKFKTTDLITAAVLSCIVANIVGISYLSSPDMLHATVKTVFDGVISHKDACLLISHLVSRKADINYIGYDGKLPLAYACSFKGCPTYLVDIFSDGIANIDHATASGETALSFLCLNENFDGIKLLLLRGANPGIIPREIKDKFTAQVRDFVSDNMFVDDKSIKESAEALAKGILRQSSASKFLSTDQIDELQEILSQLLYKSTFMKRLYNDNDTSVILLRNDMCEVVGKKITSFIANTHLFSPDTGKFSPQIRPAIQDALTAAYTREKIAVDEEKSLLKEGGGKFGRSKDRHRRKSVAVSSPAHDEDRLPYEKQKELSTKQKERDFRHKLSKLKDKAPKCNTDKPEELRNIDKQFQELESQANIMRNSEFYILRASFYEKAADKDADEIRKQTLYKKALQDYNRVLDIDTFATGITSRIEYIKERLKINPSPVSIGSGSSSLASQTSIANAIPSSYEGSYVAQNNNASIPQLYHYSIRDGRSQRQRTAQYSSTAAAAAGSNATTVMRSNTADTANSSPVLMPQSKYTELPPPYQSSWGTSNPSSSSSSLNNISAAAAVMSTTSAGPVDSKNLTDDQRAEIERIKAQMRAQKGNKK